AAWDTALASGVLNHMPSDRVARYADLYRIVDNTAGLQRTENVAVSHLLPLAYDRSLSDAEKAHYLELVGEMEHVSVGFAISARYLLRNAHALGVDPPPDQVA